MVLEKRIERILRFTELFDSYLPSTTSICLTLLDYNIEVLRSIHKNFLRGITKLTIHPPPLLMPSSSLDITAFRNAGLYLKEFVYCGGCLSFMEDIWEVLGGSLETVTVRNVSGLNNGWVQCINKLKIYCGKLTRINFRNHKRRGNSHRPVAITEEIESAYVDFLCSYGPQLVDVELFSELKTEYLMTYSGHDFSRFPTLGNKLYSLNLFLKRDVTYGNLSPLASAMQSCTSLTKLCAGLPDRKITEDFIKALFPRPQNSLESLRLFFRKKSEIPSSFEHIALVTSQLKVLDWEIHSSLSPASIITVCHANPGLTSIRIACMYGLPPENGNLLTGTWTSSKHSRSARRFHLSNFFQTRMFVRKRSCPSLSIVSRPLFLAIHSLLECRFRGY